MRIALISDVHLEYHTNLEVDFSEADVLVCAGDVGSPFTKAYRDFLRRACQHYDHVLVIAGNHEYYHHSEAMRWSHPRSMKEVEDKIEAICDEVGALFLQQSRVEIGDVLFYGCTLWGDPSSSHGKKVWSKRYDAKHISDFKSVHDYLRLHQHHKEWLTTQLSEKTALKKVVITHHLPSYALIESKFEGSPTNGYYTSHCDDLVEKADLWLAGHTHCPIDKKVRGIRCLCNPIGYPWERCPYDKDLKIDI